MAEQNVVSRCCYLCNCVASVISLCLWLAVKLSLLITFYFRHACWDFTVAFFPSINPPGPLRVLNIKYSKVLFFGLYRFKLCKHQNIKISCQCTFELNVGGEKIRQFCVNSVQTCAKSLRRKNRFYYNDARFVSGSNRFVQHIDEYMVCHHFLISFFR